MNRIVQQKSQQPKQEEWILQLSQVITDPMVLLEFLELDRHLINLEMLQARKQFPVRVPRPYLARIKKGDWDDPLLKQVLCHADEMQPAAGFVADPLQEQQNLIPGLLHKYHNRALLITKTNCAINCRYCFRRHFPYQVNQGNKQNLSQALTYLAQHPEIDEVVLSGGDPLMAKDWELEALFSQLAAITHIKRLRIHSRLAVVLPSRITHTLLECLMHSRLQMILVTHINHANEIDDEVQAAMYQLRQHQVTLLNQSVLLKGVNDSAQRLAALSNKLFDSGILPYYLHLLDHVQGAAHFLVEDQQAKQIMDELACLVSGYLVPKLAREVGGEKYKRVISY